MRKFGLAVAAVGFAAMIASPALAGNDSPSGPHYGLNIIGVPKTKTADMTGNNGHRIFVKLEGNTKILLCESGSTAADKNNDLDCSDVGTNDFQVLDANGTDGTAAFALPNPDPEGDGSTVYSVFARAPGNYGGTANITTCATETGVGGVCSEQILTLSANGNQKFQNVSKFLLYLYIDTTGDGSGDTRIALFDDDYEDFLWDYENNGLKLAQLRFYECVSIVPDAPGNGPTDGSDCFN